MKILSRYGYELILDEQDNLCPYAWYKNKELYIIMNEKYGSFYTRFGSKDIALKILEKHLPESEKRNFYFNKWLKNLIDKVG